MSMLSKLGFGIRPQATEQNLDHDHNSLEKEANVNTTDPERNGSIAFNDATKGTDVPVEESAQRGIQKVEAATSAWTKWALAGVLCK